MRRFRWLLAPARMATCIIPACYQHPFYRCEQLKSEKANLFKHFEPTRILPAWLPASYLLPPHTPYRRGPMGRAAPMGCRTAPGKRCANPGVQPGCRGAGCPAPALSLYPSQRTSQHRTAPSGCVQQRASRWGGCTRVQRATQRSDALRCSGAIATGPRSKFNSLRVPQTPAD